MPSRNATVKSLNLRIVALQRQVTAANEDRNAAFQKALVLADALVTAVNGTSLRTCPFCSADMGLMEAHDETCIVTQARTLLIHARRKSCG